MPHPPAGPPHFYEGSYEPMEPCYEEDWATFGVGESLSGVYTCPECRGNPRRTDPNRAPCTYCGGQGVVYANSAGAAERDHTAHVPAARAPQSGGPGGSSAGSRHASGGSRHASGGSRRSSGGNPRPASSNR